MSTQALNSILNGIKEFLQSNQLVREGDEPVFVGKDQAVRVDFDESRHLFELKLCDVADGQPDEAWRVISSWLFLPEHGEKETQSIANDFKDTLRESLGLEKPRVNTSGVGLPSKGKKGDFFTHETFTQRFLTLFPQFKETYKQHVSQYGECYYVHFFEETAVAHLHNLLKEDNKKQLAKFCEMLNEVYTAGEKETSAIISGIIIPQAVGDDEKLKARFMEYVKEHRYLVLASEFMFAHLKKQNKKRKAV